MMETAHAAVAGRTIATADLHFRHATIIMATKSAANPARTMTALAIARTLGGHIGRGPAGGVNIDPSHLMIAVFDARRLTAR